MWYQRLMLWYAVSINWCILVESCHGVCVVLYMVVTRSLVFWSSYRLLQALSGAAWPSKPHRDQPRLLPRRHSAAVQLWFRIHAERRERHHVHRTRTLVLHHAALPQKRRWVRRSFIHRRSFQQYNSPLYSVCYSYSLRIVYLIFRAGRYDKNITSRSFLTWCVSRYVNQRTNGVLNSSKINDILLECPQRQRKNDIKSTASIQCLVISPPYQRYLRRVYRVIIHHDIHILSVYRPALLLLVLRSLFI